MLSGLARRRAEFGQGNGSILLDDVSCRGYEDSITDCHYHGIGHRRHSCDDHSKDAGVECGNIHTKLIILNGVGWRLRFSF